MKPKLTLNPRRSSDFYRIFCRWLWMSMCVAFWGFAALAQMAPGSALNLNGINGYASVALGETLTNYTLSAWVYLRSGGAFANPRVAVVSSTCGATTEFLIRGTNSTSDVQYLELGRCFQYEGAVSIASVPLNTWVQVSVTVTNRPDGNFVSFYTNGISAGVTVLPLTNDISLGPNVALGYNDGSSRKFDGYLDEVQIWRGVVPPITTHVLNGAETNLRAYYRFDEGTGSSSANLAIATNASSATLQGSAAWLNIPANPFPPGSPLIGSDWIARGPSPMEGPYTTTGILIPPNFAGVGNVRAVAAHPTNADIIYVGAVNGGVWKTYDATSTNPTPTWVPLTDYQPSLSVSSLAFDPMDTTYQTLLAGIGAYSACGLSGALTGLLRTTDGGNTWKQITAELSGVSLIAVAARGNILLAASAESGLYRSVNGGINFTNLSTTVGSGLPAGGIDAIAGVPGNNGRLYVASRTGGVYRSDNFGATWTNTSSLIVNPISGCGPNTARVALSVHKSVSAEALYAVVANYTSGDIFGRNTRTYFYYSTDSGTNWTSLGPVIDFTNLTYGTSHNLTMYLYGGDLTLAVGADPTNASLAYVSGSYGMWGGEVVRVDRSGATPFTPLFPPSEFNTCCYAPVFGRTTHADSHVITFNAKGDLIESDDGGVFLLPYVDASAGTNGIGAGGGWQSLIGNLQIAEIVSVAYDPRGQALFGGMQDIGANRSAPGSPNVWVSILGGDGGDVGIDSRSTQGISYRYTGGSGLSPAVAPYASGLDRSTFDVNGQYISSTNPPLTVLGGPAATAYGSTFAVNTVDTRRLLFGFREGFYESTDQGDTLRLVGTNNARVVNLSKMVYGGSLKGIPNPDVIWACSDAYWNPAITNHVGYPTVRFRSSAGGELLPTAFTNLAQMGYPLGVVANPKDWREAFVWSAYGSAAKLWWTTNAGVNWDPVTGNLDPGPFIRTAEYLSLASGDALAIGTDDGVYVSLLDAGFPLWRRLGSSLPRAIVYDMQYDLSDQVLAVGTVGRGAWTFPLANWPTNEGPGMALSLGEGATNYVNSLMNNALSNNYTIGAWVNLRSGGRFSGPRVAVLSSIICGANTELLITSVTTNMNDLQYLQLARCSNYDGVLSTIAVPLNQWVYVAATVGPTLGSGGSVSNLVSYYIDGVPAGSSYRLNLDLSIGQNVAWGFNNGTNRKFDGLLDQVTIWSVALTPADIATVMTKQPTGIPSIDNAVALSLSFDEGTGSFLSPAPFALYAGGVSGPIKWAPSGAFINTVGSVAGAAVKDISANSATLSASYSAMAAPPNGLLFQYGPTTSYGSLAPASVTPRTVLTLDGINDYVTTSQSMLAPQNFTLSLWFKTTSQNGGRLLGFSHFQTNASDALDRHLYIGTDGILRFGIYSVTYEFIQSPAPCNDGRWHQAAATFALGQGPSLYMDGTLVAADPAYLGQAFSYSDGGFWRMGWDEMSNWPGASTNSAFAGAMAEVQIWNNALSAQEIAANFYRSFSGNENNLEEYYRLNESSGVNAADSAPANGSNQGTLINGPIWTPTFDLPIYSGTVVSNLEPATTYHFRAVGTNAAGTIYGTDQSFTTLAPTLSAVIESGNIWLSWPNPASGFVLEQTPSLSPLSWTVLPPPYVTSGSTIQTNLPLTGGANLFRLHRP